MKYMRYAIARWVIHLGLKIMPPGRARNELTDMMWIWHFNVINIIGDKEKPSLSTGRIMREDGWDNKT